MIFSFLEYLLLMAGLFAMGIAGVVLLAKPDTYRKGAGVIFVLVGFGLFYYFIHVPGAIKLLIG